MKIGNDIGSSLTAQLYKNILEEQVVCNKAKLSYGSTVKTEDLTENSARSNLMESNFVKNDYGPSKYIQGMMIGLQVKNQFRTKLQGLVAGSQALITCADNYAEGALVGKKAARATKELVAAEVLETEITRLETERNESGAKTGKTLDDKATGNSEETSTADVVEKTEDISTSEISSSQQIYEAAVSQGDSVHTISGVKSQELPEALVSKPNAAQQEADASPDVPSSDIVLKSSIDIMV